MNLKNVLFAGIAASALFATRPANAGFVTGTANINVNSGAVSAPVSDVLQIDQTGGELYTNQYSGTGVGALVRTVGMLQINTLETPGGNASPIGGVGSAVQQLTVAFAIQGTVVSVNPTTGIQVAVFDKGGFGIWQANQNESNTNPAVDNVLKNNASTWFNFNANSVAALTSNAAYLAQLIAPDAIIPNPGGANFGAQIFFAGAQVNVSAENLIAPQQQQGQFLFGDTFNPGFITNTTAPGKLPYGGELFSVTNQTAQFKSPGVLDNTQLVNTYVAGSPAAVGGWANSQTVLNQISQLFLGANFANFGGGGAADWTPSTARNGDFSATVSAQTNPNVVPEPTSMALLATGSVLAGLFARRRKATKKDS